MRDLNEVSHRPGVEPSGLSCERWARPSVYQLSNANCMTVIGVGCDMMLLILRHLAALSNVYGGKRAYSGRYLPSKRPIHEAPCHTHIHCKETPNRLLAESLASVDMMSSSIIACLRPVSYYDCCYVSDIFGARSHRSYTNDRHEPTLPS